MNLNPKPYNQYPKTSHNLSNEQKRALGLCYRCNEKWSQGHRCARGLHTIEGEEEDEGDVNQYEVEIPEELEEEEG